MDQYIIDLSRVAGITPHRDETLTAFGRRVAVHAAYAEAQSCDALAEGLDASTMEYHAARAACCKAIISACSRANERNER